MDAELVFLGELRDNDTATLIVNREPDEQREYFGGFRITLPLESAAFSDDGSKKN